MTATLEQPRSKEQSSAVYLDTTLIKVSENINEQSVVELRETEPGEGYSSPIYMCSPKDNTLSESYDKMMSLAQESMTNTASHRQPEDVAFIQANDIDMSYQTADAHYVAGTDHRESMPRPAFCTFSPRGELIWSANNKPETVGVLLVHSNGSMEQLGAGQDAASYGVTSLEAGDKVLMMPNKVIDGMKEYGLFDIDGLEKIKADDDLSANLVSISFDEAILTTPTQKTEGQLEATSRSVEERQRQIREKLGLPIDATDAQVREARKAARSNRPSKKSVITGDEESLDDTMNSMDVMQVFADDKELQAQITDATRFKSTNDEPAFTVTNKRVRSRKELLYASLDQLPGDSPVAEPSPVVTGPIIPPKPDYDPTVHLNTTTNSEPQTEAMPTPERMSWKEKLRNSLAYLAGQMDSYRFIHQNKLEEKYSSEQLAERNKNQETALKVILGVTAGALVAVTAWKLGHDMASVQNLSTGIGNADGDWVTKAPTTKTTPPLAPPHFEFSADASTVTNGEGWYQTIQETTGITDPARQAAILQKIGPALQEKGWAYPMTDGTWGISRPGTLPKDVLELIKNSR